MASDPKWYTSDDALLTSANRPILSGDSGTESAAVILRLYNDKDEAGADTLPPSQVYGQVRVTSSGQLLSEGHPLVDRRMVEGRITQGLGGKVVPSAGWSPLGVGRFLAIPSLASGEGVELEFKLNVPSFSPGLNVFFVPTLAIETGLGLGFGLSEIAGDGIYLGIGDPLINTVLIGNDVIENPAGADDEVRVGPFVYLDGGIPLSFLEQNVAIAASSAGNRRYVLLSLTDDATLTQTDGDETAAALTDDDEPDAPLDETVVARVEVDDSGVITQDDIENRWQRGAYHVSFAGSSATVGPGQGLVDNWITYNQVSQSATLTADSVNSLWLLRSGQLAVTVNGAPPVSTRSLLLAELTTDAGNNVIAFADRRRFIGHRVHLLRFEWPGVLAVDDFRYAISLSDRPVYIFPIRGLRASVAVSGTVSDATQFLAEADNDYDDTFLTDLILPISAPEIAFDATDLRSLDAIPANHLIAPGARIRAWLDEIPAGGDAEDAVLEMLLVEV